MGFLVVHYGHDRYALVSARGTWRAYFFPDLPAKRWRMCF